RRARPNRSVRGRTRPAGRGAGRRAPRRERPGGSLMRPHRLTLTAFGAFPETVELDLDRLGAGGLFLLCGEPGAGKTPLLDGIGFALFNRVPGKRGEARPDLRSHHAPHDRGTRAELEFSVSAGRYRVTRTPAYERPRRRGDGTTREQPSA